MEHEAGVISLTENGVVSKWTREAPPTGRWSLGAIGAYPKSSTKSSHPEASNRWVQAKIVTADIEKITDTGSDKTCFVFHKDRFAISFPKSGIFIWVLQNGTPSGHRDEAQLRSEQGDGKTLGRS